MDYFLLALGILFGFIFWQIFAGKHEGDKIEKSFRFLIGNYYIHIHHWLWCGILLLVLVWVSFYNSFLYGLLLGSLIQGLRYKDRFYIIYHKDKFNEIYSKFKK